jgi:hypothetical protein
MAKSEEKRRSKEELLRAACEPNYQGRYKGTNFDKLDVLNVAELIKEGLVELKDNDEDYGTRLMPTDLGWLRFHQAMADDFRRKLSAPKEAV